MKLRCFIGAILFLALTACHRPVETCHGASLTSELVSIDSLMQTRPDSALVLLQASPKEDPYYQLLLSEALYKNDSAQLNRPELMEAMAHYDSLGCPFLSARCHYMNGVGYYEMDSVVEACQEYLKALEIMEGHYQEKDLVGYKAKFMALTYTRLIEIYSDRYLHEQVIHLSQLVLKYYNRYDASFRQYARILDEIGSQYDMMEQLDSAYYYYSKSLEVLTDTDNITYRTAASHLASLDYKNNPKDYASCLLRLFKLLDLSENGREYYAGLLSIGEIYYHEKIFDSAFLYLDSVFENSNRVGCKKQAAEWLVEIGGMDERFVESQEYLTYLAPFANLEENNSSLKSQLTGLYYKYEQERNLFHRRKMVLIQKRKGLFLLGMSSILIIAFLAYYYVSKKKTRDTTYSNRISQSAMSGRLKLSNELLRNTQRQLDEAQKNGEWASDPNNKDYRMEFNAYLESPICLHIIDIVEKQQFKSKMDFSLYKEHALSKKQLLELRKSADDHLAHFSNRIIRKYPSFKQEDIDFCCLYLLGLKNADVSALLQKAYPTVCERDRKIRRIIGQGNDLVTVLTTI